MIQRTMPLVVLALVLVAAFPDVAHACPVCFDSRDENRQAFLATTVFLSLFPLGMVGGLGLWVRRRSKELDARYASDRADLIDRTDAEG